MAVRRIIRAALVGACLVFAAGPAVGAEPPSAVKPVTVVVFGDSTTAPRPSVRVYADCLRSDLPGKGMAVEVINAGVGGNSTRNARARFEKDVLDRHPDRVVIQFGINDSTVNVWAKPPATQAPVTRDQYAANLQYFIQALREQGADVILMTPNPMRWTPKLRELYGKPPYRPADPDGLNVTLGPYAACVREVAAGNNVPLVDVYAAFQAYGAVKGQSVDDLLLDGMHPNDRGHRIIADLLMGEIMKSKTGGPQGGADVSKAAVSRVKLLPPGPDNPRNSEGDFIQLKDGRLLFVYTHFTGTTGDDGAPCHLAGRTSGDGGRTWTTNDVMIVSGTEARSGNVMSVTLLRLQDGRIALFYLRKNGGLDCRPIMRISTDEAQTWSEPRVCVSEADVGYYVLNNDRVVQLKSGRLVMPLARHDDLTGTKFNHHPRTLCYLSDDNGVTWRSSKTVLPGILSGLQEPGVVELRDGRLMMFCRGGGGFVYRSFSADGGETWSPDERYPGIRSPLSAPAIERIPKTGDLLLVWNNHAGIATNAQSPYYGKRTPYNTAISRDEGKTWEHIRTLEDDPNGWYCYTAIEFVGDDVLLAYCAGHQPRPEAPLPYDTKLAATQIARFSVDWLYGGAPGAAVIQERAAREGVRPDRPVQPSGHNRGSEEK
jgi:lysophospholipase L1-like esterase